jgi:hypothetical protein
VGSQWRVGAVVGGGVGLLGGFAVMREISSNLDEPLGAGDWALGLGVGSAVGAAVGALVGRTCPRWGIVAVQ